MNAVLDREAEAACASGLDRREWTATKMLIERHRLGPKHRSHTHKQQPTSQTSKHSSQLSSPHHLSTHRLLPDVCLVPEEVCLHRTLSWNRPRLTSACMAIPHYSTRHTNERHTQDTIARKLPRNCDAHITPKPLNMASISLILRACTQPNPRAASQFTSSSCDEGSGGRRLVG